MTCSPGDASSLRDLIAKLREGTLTAPERASLREMLQGGAEARQVFARYAVLEGLLELEIAGAVSDESRAGGDDRPRPSPSFSAAPFPLNLLYLSGDTPAVAALMWLVLALGAGLVIMVFAMLVVAIRGVHVTVDAGELAKKPASAAPADQAAPPQPVVAACLRRMVDCQWSGDQPAPAPGESLTEGRRLELNAGLAEVVFQNGATLLLRGPADMQVSSRGSAYLRRGSLTATVESPRAKGFEVHTPGMKYTDLGTEFGVLVRRSGVQEVHVFRGKVQAETSGPWSVVAGQNTSSLRPQASSLKPVLLATNEALRVTAPEAPLQRIAADQSRFLRAVPEPKIEPIPLLGTGVSLDRGQADPHWQIVAISSDPKFKPQQAVVAEVVPCHAADSREKGQWMGTAKVAAVMPNRCRWRVRTQLDLTGFDPTTVCIDGQFVADDFLVDLRVNGEMVPFPLNPKTGYAEWRPLHLDRGFHAGVNTIEMVIENFVAAEGCTTNVMGFGVQWSGTARRLLTGAEEEPATAAR